MSNSRKNTLSKALPAIGIAFSALIWMGAPSVSRAADPDIFDGDLVIPDPVVKYGLKKILENIKIKMPGLPQMGSQGSSGSSGSSGGSMGSSGGSGGLPMGSSGSGGSLPSLGKSGQSGIGMQDGDSLGLGQGDNQGLGQKKGDGQMPGQGQGQGEGQMEGQGEGQMPGQGQGNGLGNNGSEGGMIAQGDQAGEGPMGEGSMGNADAANTSGDQKGGSQGMKGDSMGGHITIGDVSEMIEMAGDQGGDSDSGKAEGAESGTASKGPPMAGKNRGRASGVERGESIPSDL